jgi:putative ABC transport system permease protein
MIPSLRSRRLATALLREAADRMRAEWRDDLVVVAGLAWGAAAVIFLMAVGAGLAAFLDVGFAKTGDRWTVVAGRHTAGRADSLRPGHAVVLERRDLDQLAAGTPSASWVGAEVSSRWATVRSRDRTRSNVVVGASPSIGPMKALRIGRGRFFDESDDAAERRVAVIGASLAPIFFPRADPVGATLRIEGEPFAVVGVLERVGQQLVVTSGLHDEIVWVPLRAGQRVLGRGDAVDLVYASAANVDDDVRLERELRETLGRTHRIERDDDTALFHLSIVRIAKPIRLVGRLLELLLGLIGAITLSIAAVSVANALVSRVHARRVELAVRRACGARRSDVIVQIFLETALLVTVGGGAGAALGALLVTLLASLPLPEMVPLPKLSGAVVAWSVILLVATAFLAALAPARLAGRADPAAAMREP